MLTTITRHGFTFQVAAASAIQLPPLPGPDEDYEPRNQADYGSRKAKWAAIKAEAKARGDARRAEQKRKRELRERVIEWPKPTNIPGDIEAIQRATIAAFEIKEGAFFGPSKKEPISSARIVSMALCRKLTDHELVAIGAAHNRPHDTSVTYAVERFEGFSADDLIREKIGVVEKQLADRIHNAA